MNYASIRTCDIANGEGVRVSLFVSGCTHHCKGCFNPDQWDFSYGSPFTREVEDEILRSLEPSFISGLTILGGEPMEPANQRVLLPFIRRFRERFGSSRSLWVYTGCVLDTATMSLQPQPFNVPEMTREFLLMVDVLVDGPFVEELKDISLKFRGSSNQRILKMQELQGLWSLPIF